MTKPTTPIELPAPVAAYFTADERGPDELARCFTTDAIVVDERHTHRGRAAIAAWRADTAAKYSSTSEPLTAHVEGAKVIVSARVTGNFPGSPVELRYAFTTAGDSIARLEIAS